jgi:3-dehydroquinate synthase
MKVIQQTFQVTYSYPVVFTRNLFGTSELRDFIENFGQKGYRKKVLFVVDKGVFEQHAHIDYAGYIPGSSVLIVAGGEEVKRSAEALEAVLAAINDKGIDRHSFVVAVGGGAVLDMVGYASAIAHRGVKLIRVPTTVLSQNDSAVGVKNSINYFGKKNFLGTFVPPVAVFNDFDFLRTLSPRDQISGISEAVKVALIKDLTFFEWLERHAGDMRDGVETVMEEQIIRSAEHHLAHIRSGDPFELGSARPLDFGHWAAHKLEYLTDFEVKHGEAVAIGIALDVCYSQLVGYLSTEDRDRVLKVLETIGFTLYHPALAENDKIHLWEGLNEFREHLGGQLTITLLEKLGKGVEVHEMDFEKVKAAVDHLAGRIA